MKKVFPIILSIVFLLSCHSEPKPDIVSYDFIQVASDPQCTSCDITCLNESVQNSDKVHARLLLSHHMNLDEVEIFSMDESQSRLRCHLPNLAEGTRYYFTLEAYSNYGVHQSKEVYQFTTLVKQTISVTTGSVTDITQTTAKGTGMVAVGEGVIVTERGLCWSTEHEPTIQCAHYASGSGVGEINVMMSELTPDTQYYVRAYAISSSGTEYGAEVSFNTNSADLPEVFTRQVSGITTTMAVGHGQVMSEGTSPITERGMCWSSEHAPLVSGNHSSAGAGPGNFSVTISDLTPNATYYLRAYAINEFGIAYGAEVSFNTLDGLPDVETVSVTDVTASMAIGHGKVTDQGGSVINEYGFCWSTAPNPTTENTHIASGGDIGQFDATIYGLDPCTKYFLCAYATNEQGTAYGMVIEFKTSALKPSVVTGEVNDITQTTAISWGEVTSDGGADVIERGICWSTEHEPNIDGNHSSNGIGMGNFSVELTDLKPGKTYYVRAYAINEVGKSYGNEVNFTTQPSGPPSGAVNGIFTINANGDQVYFSKGNLQYQASTNKWRFAEHQWDCFGEANSNISSSYSGWIDLFGWGTSSYDHGAVCYQPWSVSTNYADYYAYGSGYNNLYDQTGKADWGYNAISNGENIEHQWRTLTGGPNGEWEFLFDLRNTSSGIRYAKACVNGVNGIVIVPDNWNASTYALNSPNNTGTSYSENCITLIEWDGMLEPSGCVFLPTAGGRNGTSVSDVGSRGYYWSSSYYISDFAYAIGFGSGYIGLRSYGGRCDGFCVRLVSDY